MALVSWWKFDEGTGTTAADSAGSNTGTLQTGSTWTKGYIGPYSVANDGSTGYIDAGSNSSLNFTSSDFSIAFWFRTNASVAGKVFFARGAFQTNGYYIQPADGNGQMRLYTNQSGAAQLIKGNGAWSQGVWTHCAVTRSGSTGKIYLNGLEDTYSVQDSISNPTTCSTNFLMAAYTGAILNAQIDLDDVRVYDNALTASDVWGLYSDSRQIGNGFLIKPVF